MKNKLLFTGFEWDVELIEKLWTVIDKYGKEKYQLDYHVPQFEITTADQMLDAYTSHGMPIYYRHWSFGKKFVTYQKEYREGKMGLAYEMVINSNPCIAYLMEDNTATMQALVMAHANCGHASFFKTNYLFQQHTNPDNILDVLETAKTYIQECEDKYGTKRVARFIDHCHTLQYHAINKYPKPLSDTKEMAAKRKEEQIQAELAAYSHIWETLPNDELKTSLRELLKRSELERALKEGVVMDEENLLEVLRVHSLKLEPWQREIMKIVCYTSQYFYPQMQTQIMNEGWATFIHYSIMTDLYNDGYIDEGSYLEFLDSHVGVTYQRDHSQINPYALGFAMFQDLKRACLDPDEEDYKWLPDIAGKKDWLKELKNIVKYFKDESFVLQYLSPKVIRKFQLFALIADEDENPWEYVVTGISSDEDIQTIRRAMSRHNEIDNKVPSIKCIGINKMKNKLQLEVGIYKNREISVDSGKFLIKALKALWGGEIALTTSEDSTEFVIDDKNDPWSD